MAESGQYFCVRAPIAALAVLVSAACGGAAPPTAPANAQVSRVVHALALQGHTVSAADGSALASITVQLGTQFPATSDAHGYFSLDHDLAGASAIQLSGATIVPRETAVQLPADGVATFGLIPASFDLVAFNEMFRGSQARLQRWTAAPALVVLTSVMRFESSEATVAEATDEQIASDDVDTLVREMTQALALLTGNSFPAFARVTLERTPHGSPASTARDGAIVVGRYRDLKALNRVVGYGRCAERGGVITAGSVALDAAFDAASDRRRVLRAHELGHALGYKHVTTRPSIMNPALGSDVTEFDRQGAAIAFQRPPGNRAPDADPLPAVRPASDGARWSAPVE